MVFKFFCAVYIKFILQNLRYVEKLFFFFFFLLDCSLLYSCWLFIL